MAEREASGDFDYLWDDPADVDGLTSHDAGPRGRAGGGTRSPAERPGRRSCGTNRTTTSGITRPDPDDETPGHFDAFNVNTWSFKPAPTPWYRTRQALTAIIAASAAVAAIVVSGVLLVFRGQGGTVDDVTSSVTPTAPTSAAPAQVASSEAPPPPLTAHRRDATASPPPEHRHRHRRRRPRRAGDTRRRDDIKPRTYQPRQTKGPEISVTRTRTDRSASRRSRALA